MREAYGFTKGAALGVKLRAHGIPRQLRELPRGGLYLDFPPTLPFARVRLGTGYPVDLLPAQSGGVPMHVMAVATPAGERYAGFNLGRGEIVLRERIREDCLFEWFRGKPTKQGEETVQIKILKDKEDVEGKAKVQVRVQGTAIREFDGEDAESSEVSFVDAPTADSVRAVEWLVISSCLIVFCSGRRSLSRNEYCTSVCPTAAQVYVKFGSSPLSLGVL